MKCPLKTAYILGNEGMEFVQGECIRGKCAWWFETTQQCAVDRIASNLSGINNALGAILAAMPRQQKPAE